MIIVKTKNGDRFINDKAVTMVAHDREVAVVEHSDHLITTGAELDITATLNGRRM